jgi:hypothetical protein
MEPLTGAQCVFGVKAFYKNGDSFVIAQREFRWEFGIHRNRAVSSAHAIKTWVRNFDATGSTLKKKGGSVKRLSTPENIAVEREAIERSPHRSACRQCVTRAVWSQRSTGFTQSSSLLPLQNSTSNSAICQTNSYGDASKSNAWLSQETYRVPRAEW